MSQYMHINEALQKRTSSEKFFPGQMGHRNVVPKLGVPKLQHAEVPCRPVNQSVAVDWPRVWASTRVTKQWQICMKTLTPGWVWPLWTSQQFISCYARPLLNVVILLSWAHSDTAVLHPFLSLRWDITPTWTCSMYHRLRVPLRQNTPSALETPRWTQS